MPVRKEKDVVFERPFHSGCQRVILLIKRALAHIIHHSSFIIHHHHSFSVALIVGYCLLERFLFWTLTSLALETSRSQGMLVYKQRYLKFLKKYQVFPFPLTIVSGNCQGEEAASFFPSHFHLLTASHVFCRPALRPSSSSSSSATAALSAGDARIRKALV